MKQTAKTKLIRIGNSRGIRIPKDVIDRLHLTDEIEMIIAEDHLEVRSGRRPREGWDAAFQQMAVCGDDKLLDESVATQWGEEEWDW